jgi:hypothetical protein
MGDRVRAAQAAAAEEAKNMAAYNTPANLPPINANMQVPQNSWTLDAQGNPVFQVPGFLNSPAPVQPGSIADYVSKMHGLPSNPAFDALHRDFNASKHDGPSTLESLLAKLSPNYSGGKSMSPDPIPMMRHNNGAQLARLNAIAPGANPEGPPNTIGSSYAPPQQNDLQSYLMQLMSRIGQGNISLNTPWGKGRMS